MKIPLLSVTVKNCFVLSGVYKVTPIPGITDLPESLINLPNIFIGCGLGDCANAFTKKNASNTIKIFRTGLNYLFILNSI
jgi:hypothetical protein